MRFSEMPYKRVTYEEIEAKAKELLDKMENAEDVSQALDVFYEYNRFSDKINTAVSLSYIKFTLNTEDGFFVAEKEYYDEVMPKIQDVDLRFRLALYNSKFKEQLKIELGELLFLNIEINMKAFNPKIIPHMQEENRLVNEYDKLLASAQIEFDNRTVNLSQLGKYKQNMDRAVRKAAYEAEAGFYLKNSDKLDSLYDELVKIRTKMARELGYENFVELGYYRMMRNSYTKQDVQKFREYVKKYIVPIASDLKNEQKSRINVDKFMLYDDPLEFMSGNAVPKGDPEHIFAQGKKMYAELSPQTEEFMNFMLNNELFDVISRKGKVVGGYSTSLPEFKAPFVFANFNGTSGDIDVLTHEAGHAFASYLAKDFKIGDYRSPTLESCEIHSMSMEFFTWPWMQLFFEEQSDKYKYAHLSGALTFIPYGTIVDYFQHIIYEKPDLTPDERKGVWKKLQAEYMPYLNTEGMPFFEDGRYWQRQHHIYSSPFYYIDYCLAQTVALEYWAESQQDYKKAWNKYISMTSRGGKDTFKGLVSSAGLESPFEEGALKKVAMTAREWLKSFDKEKLI
ncbi:MAG: M3 family oligoendopeptidase [Clostridia bacterium]|jgi:M3 family oligoendopeptidase|nr:M3 family oligoendopeptidase [Clostridia bacterium]MDD4501630.1 M3 family oligoendopeptidase [Clostridia bacterium]HPB16155.1 M3 family oligoendopeptidase [Clostridia bacterium]HQM96279.1 M3 family oligoendopeptidase [Clostridia bacterium]HQO69469.1 M3 family oligoendopeptidase [Clostridia bacterium]